MSKIFWFLTGIFFLGIAFVGVVVPGIPWSTPSVIAAYCFAKSSTRMHNWMHNHPLFGPFLKNWAEKKIFPIRLKYAMLVTMASSLAITWFATGNEKAVLWTGIFMIAVAVWAWRYPGSEEEHQRRASQGKRIAWLK